MSDRRFPELTPETMTDEQRQVAEAIQAGPRGAGLRGPCNALMRSPQLCDLVQRVGAYVRYSPVRSPAAAERAGDLHGRPQVGSAIRILRPSQTRASTLGWRPAILDSVANGPPTRRAMSSDETIVYEFVMSLLEHWACAGPALPGGDRPVRRTRRDGSGRRGRLLQFGIDGAERRPGAAAGRGRAAIEAALKVPSSRTALGASPRRRLPAAENRRAP